LFSSSGKGFIKELTATKHKRKVQQEA